MEDRGNCIIFVPNITRLNRMKLLKDQLIRTMLQNFLYALEIVVKNLENTGTVDGNYGKRSDNPAELKRLKELQLTHPERAMAYTEMASDPHKKMEELISRSLSKIFTVLRWLGFGKVVSDERLIIKLKEMASVMRNALDAYRGPMAEFVCDSDHSPQVIALMHYFLDTKTGREAALYVKGFEYARFIRMPSLPALTEEFPHIGPKSTLNDNFSGKKVTPFTKEEIQDAAATICMHDLCKEILHKHVDFVD